MIVEKPGEAVGGEEASEVVSEGPADSIASQAPFKLVFLFPAPEAPEDVLKASGGVLLKVNYEHAWHAEMFHPIFAAGSA